MRQQTFLDVPYSAEFLRFWNLYPWRSKKADAWKAFQQLHCERLMAQIETALSWQVTQPKWLEAGGKYIPLPASWIRARCFEDEPFHLSTLYAPRAHHPAVFWYTRCKKAHFGECTSEAEHVAREEKESK